VPVLLGHLQFQLARRYERFNWFDCPLWLRSIKPDACDITHPTGKP